MPILSPVSSSKLLQMEESLKQARTDLLLKLFNDKMELKEERFSSMAAHQYFTEKAAKGGSGNSRFAKSNKNVRNSHQFYLDSRNSSHHEQRQSRLHFKDVKVAQNVLSPPPSNARPPVLHVACSKLSILQNKPALGHKTKISQEM